VGEQALRDGLAAGIRGFVLYNYPYAGSGMHGPGRYMEMSYEHLIAEGEKLWAHWRRLTEGRFWPTVMPGWDRRPWLRDNDLLRTGSTPDLFRKSLQHARNYVNADRVVMIEAWNEWGEGSILEPSVEHRFAYLDAVRSVFCPGASEHRDLTPADLRRKPPAFDLQLPRITQWTFDFNPQGWTGKGVDELRTDHGALVITTTSGDPQIAAPATYIDCSRYGRLRLRLKAVALAGGPEQVPAQVFWSTVRYAMREDTSLPFAVRLDGCWHIYDINLRESPKWTGLADALRLDLADRPGITLHLDEVRLMEDRGGG